MRHVAASAPRCRVLDMGTGSGNIAIAVAASLTAVEVTALDISLVALPWRSTMPSLPGRRARHFVCGDLLSPLIPARRASICSCPIRPIFLTGIAVLACPRCGAMSRVEALDGGHDGLPFYRHLVAEGRNYMTDAWDRHRGSRTSIRRRGVEHRCADAALGVARDREGLQWH